MTPVFSTLIEVDGANVAWISGTRVKVTEVILDKLEHGWSPEEIHFQHPHLSLAQIHGALTYYYENQDRVDSQIHLDLLEAEALATRCSDPAFRKRLSELKRSR